MSDLMTTDQAKATIAAYETDFGMLYRKAKHELVAIERSELAALGIQRAFGGPVTKEEFLSSVLELRHPSSRMDEARHVLYHDWPGAGSSGCPFCICQATHTTTDGAHRYLEQCTRQPGHDGKHHDRHGGDF